jgi:hypothetical protein
MNGSHTPSVYSYASCVGGSGAVAIFYSVRWDDDLNGQSLAVNELKEEGTSSVVKENDGNHKRARSKGKPSPFVTKCSAQDHIKGAAQTRIRHCKLACEKSMAVAL